MTTNPRKLYVPVGGTWRDYHDVLPSEGNPSWYRRGSMVYHALDDIGWARVEQDRDPETPDRGFWSGDLGGLIVQDWWGLLTTGKPRQGRKAWIAAAKDLADFLIGRLPEWKGCHVTVIAHSHAGQIAALAFSFYHFKNFYENHINKVLLTDASPPIFHLVTVDMPVRKKMAPVYREATAGRVLSMWTHLHSGRWDRMRLFGSRFGPLEVAAADMNIPILGGHSGVLEDHQYVGQLLNAMPRV